MRSSPQLFVDAFLDPDLDELAGRGSSPETFEGTERGAGLFDRPVRTARSGTDSARQPGVRARARARR